MLLLFVWIETVVIRYKERIYLRARLSHFEMARENEDRISNETYSTKKTLFLCVLTA